MSELAERLRQWEHARGSTSDILLDEVAEAAKEIERLERIAEWRLGLVAAGVDVVREVRVLCDAVDTETHEPLQQWLVNSIYNVLDAHAEPTRQSAQPDDVQK